MVHYPAVSRDTGRPAEALRQDYAGHRSVYKRLPRPVRCSRNEVAKIYVAGETIAANVASCDCLSAKLAGVVCLMDGDKPDVPEFFL